MDNTRQLIDQFRGSQGLGKEEFLYLLKNMTKEDAEYLYQQAREISLKNFGNKIFTRGLIEVTNYCRNDCYYCGIRKSNPNTERYRLTEEEILTCADQGYELGFRTFVLQGGEKAGYSAGDIAEICQKIKKQHPDCAITLSLGEWEKEVYQLWHDAGADRYLLRHETAMEEHYRKLHPEFLSLKNRKRCLWNLKEIGYQIGTGFMVGSPYQTEECLYEDFQFIKELQPHMIGIGPFVPHHDTIFKDFPGGTLDDTLKLIALLRLMCPDALLPATTALGTIAPNGRELGVKAGANVIMPNLSPVKVRKKYELYDNKICTGEEAAECRGCLQRRMQSIGYELSVTRGDHIAFSREDRNHPDME